MTKPSNKKGKMLELLTNDKFWTVLGSFFTMIAGVAAMVAVLQTRQSAKEQTASNRPYLNLESPGIKPIPNSDQFMIQFTFRNIGGRPARNFHGKVYFINQEMRLPFTFDLNITTSNDIPPNQPQSWHFTNTAVSHALPFHYVVIVFKYDDIGTKEKYKEVYYMRWHGAGDKILMWDFSGAELSEKIKLEKVLSEFL